MSWVRYPVWQHTFVSPSAFSRRAVVSYWRKYVHEVLVNRLGGLSLPRKSVVRLTDRPDMTLDVYRGRKTTMQLKCNSYLKLWGYIISIFHGCMVWIEKSAMRVSDWHHEGCQTSFFFTCIVICKNQSRLFILPIQPMH